MYADRFDNLAESSSHTSGLLLIFIARTMPTPSLSLSSTDAEGGESCRYFFLLAVTYYRLFRPFRLVFSYHNKVCLPQTLRETV